MSWRDAGWFVTGFITRAMISFIDDLKTAYRRRAMGHYIVKLRGITWDDGKGDYDVSHLPREMNVTVLADDEAEALEYALSEATDDQGFMIESVESHEIIRGRRRSD